MSKRTDRTPRDLNFRTKGTVIQAVVSPGYTPVTNAEVLQAAMDLSKIQVTTYRGQLRVTGICSNSAIVRNFQMKSRFVHRNWNREGLLQHVGELGQEAMAGISGLGDALQQMAETQLGQKRLETVERAAAKSLGVKGLEALQSEVSASVSINKELILLTEGDNNKKSLNTGDSCC